MNQHEKINYVEFPSNDVAASKTFFAKALGWTFEDYGPDYVAFHGAGIDGGFFRATRTASTDNGSALIVFFSDDLEATQSKVADSGGTIAKDIFSFPGGRRFHFTEPGGSEFAVWSDK